MEPVDPRLVPGAERAEAHAPPGQPVSAKDFAATSRALLRMRETFEAGCDPWTIPGLAEFMRLVREHGLPSCPAKPLRAARQSAAAPGPVLAAAATPPLRPVSALEIMIGYVGAAATKSVIIDRLIMATQRLFVPFQIVHLL